MTYDGNFRDGHMTHVTSRIPSSWAYRNKYLKHDHTTHQSSPLLIQCLLKSLNLCVRICHVYMYFMFCYVESEDLILKEISCICTILPYYCTYVVGKHQGANINDNVGAPAAHQILHFLDYLHTSMRVRPRCHLNLHPGGK